MIDPFLSDEQLYHQAKDIERRICDPMMRADEAYALRLKLIETRSYLSSKQTDAIDYRHVGTTTR
jgi:hypothetical protein